jgi:outer membrane protein OmpU
MKNLLIATTALVATAGVAAAEITFSGGGRFGVIHTGSTAAVGLKVGVISAANVTEQIRMDALASAVDITTIVAGATNTASILLLNTAVTSYTALDTTAKLNVANSILGTGASTTALDDAATLAALELKQVTALRTAISSTAAVAATESSSDLHNRFTLNIDGSAETDSGAEFFGRVRIRGGNTGEGATAASTVSAPRLGMKVGGLTVAVGNINGAIDSTAGVYSGSVGLTGLGYSNVVVGGFDGFSSGGGGTNGVEVIYSMNGMSAHLSHSSLAAGDRTALALTYAFGDWKVALGHQSADLAKEEFTMVRVDGSIGDITLGAAFASNDVSVGDKVRINAGFKVGAGTNVSFFVTDSDLAGADTAYGLGFTHSLGGATLAGGIVEDSAGVSKADLGVRFNF